MSQQLKEKINQVESLILENYDALFGGISSWGWPVKGYEVDNLISRIAESDVNSTVFDVLDEDEYGDYSSVYWEPEFVAAVTQKRSNLDAVIARNDNLLNVPAESAPWQDRYTHELAMHLASHGTQMRWGDGYYGWKEYNRDNTLSNKYVVAVFAAKVDHWEEFEGTFTGASSHTGITGNVVFSDGTQTRYRWEGDFTVLVRSITK